ncbi:DUF1223 domain-containing protein [Roseateles sp.]|uniref:DUF1223 domain-containing protein n=1 Tax=Roseateles sp. TaxID=1971397 RepID=UPI00286C84C9|nr:DUF1223 domain-containing protein [Roseateles sp.]
MTSRFAAALALSSLLPALGFASGGSCSARSAATQTPVIELYTSEGCSSCPPADRWLGQLPAEAGVVALAFHVDYWDRLGWKDRFASAEFTQRQALEQARNGARFSYTPQIVLDGVDRKDWPRIALNGLALTRPAAKVAIGLRGEGSRFTATVQAVDGAAPAKLAAYWAVTEQGHQSAVKAGENSGALLRHEYVVREYRPVGAWQVQPGKAMQLEFSPAQGATPGHLRQLNLVIIDALTGRPLQAVKLDC